MIVVDDLHKHFGGFHAVDGASLTIEEGSITGLIGPNGAGKTTLFNVIAGVLQPLWNTWFGRKRIADEERALRAKADEVLEFLTVEHLADQKAGQISGGQKKLLELGRTMMVDAKIVFLDEVGAGVNRTLLNTIGDAILRLNKERGYTFVVIEHDMDFIGRLCDPVICMAEGRVLAQGTLAEIKANEQVIEAYLGTGLKNKEQVGA